MINFSDLRAAIVDGINTDTEILTIEANQSAHKPPYPYITILFGGPVSGGDTHTGYLYAIDDEDDPDDDIDYTWAHNEIITLSVTAIAGDSATAQQNAIKAYEWFRWQGQQTLKDANITVVNVQAPTNRDVLIVDDWERRVGFDVRLRVLAVSVRKESWIGAVERKHEDDSTELI